MYSLRNVSCTHYVYSEESLFASEAAPNYLEPESVQSVTQL